MDESRKPEAACSEMGAYLAETNSQECLCPILNVDLLFDLAFSAFVN